MYMMYRIFFRALMQSDLLTTEVLDPANSPKNELVEETMQDLGQIDIDAEIEALPLPEEFFKQDVTIFAFPKCAVSR